VCPGTPEIAPSQNRNFILPLLVRDKHSSTMSSSHGLSDEQVSNELKRMVAFIKQEAIEKARELHIKVTPLPEAS
jgi:hypothetical protein